eukprot:1132674_1
MNCLRHFSVCKPVVVTDIVLQPRHPVDVGGVRERGGGRCSGPEGSDRCDVGRDESRRSWVDLDFGEKLHPAAQSGSPHTASLTGKCVWRRQRNSHRFEPFRAARWARARPARRVLAGQLDCVEAEFGRGRDERGELSVVERGVRLGLNGGLRASDRHQFAGHRHRSEHCRGRTEAV